MCERPTFSFQSITIFVFADEHILRNRNKLDIEMKKDGKKFFTWILFKVLGIKAPHCKRDHRLINDNSFSHVQLLFRRFFFHFSFACLLDKFIITYIIMILYTYISNSMYIRLAYHFNDRERESEKKRIVIFYMWNHKI